MLARAEDAEGRDEQDCGRGRGLFHCPKKISSATYIDLTGEARSVLADWWKDERQMNDYILILYRSRYFFGPSDVTPEGIDTV